ncbi:MAG: hypothetical protein AB1733_01680 [Thermodesulfobacteriota bacterium]
MKKLILLLTCLAFTMGSLPFATADNSWMALMQAQRANQAEQKKLDAKFKAAAKAAPEPTKVSGDQDTLNDPRIWEPIP